MALAHALLAALADTPATGYDLAKQFDGSIGFFWKATHQQIYRELAKLEAKGWLQSHIVPQVGRPDKKVFAIAEAGREELRRWMAEPTDLAPVKDDLLVKVFAGSHISDRLLLQELERHRQAHGDRLAEYERIAQCFFQPIEDLPPQRIYGYLTLRRGIRFERDWIEWCDEAIATIKSLEKSVDAP